MYINILSQIIISRIFNKPNIESELKFNIQPVIDSSHYWDCNGYDCDLLTLSPWNKYLYRNSPFYAPLNPNDFGGPKYKEKIWITGIFSDSLSKWLGNDNNCCGREPSSKGGCGKCILVTNPNSINKDYKVLVLKKGRCYPETKECEDNKLHIKLLVPGYGNFNNINNCNNKNSLLSKFQASVCGNWYKKHNNTINGCNCDFIPNKFPTLREGCKLFSKWGWRTNNPKLTYKKVECPIEFMKIIGNSFGIFGPQDPFISLPLYVNNSILLKKFCSLDNCKSKIINREWCSLTDKNCKICGGYMCDRRRL